MAFADKISAGNRKRKYARFIREFAPGPDLKLLDIGYNDTEYSPVDNYLEKHYPHPENITALGLHEPREFSRRYPMVRAVRYDGTTFPFADKSFDLCWSNAVIEHVGGRAAQVNFLKEIKRVGKAAYLTTPNRFFPVELHTRTCFRHVLVSKERFDRYLHKIGKGWAAGDYMHLLGMRDLRKLLADAGITDYKIRRNRLFGFTMDFSLMLRF